MLCWRFTIHNTLSNICCVGGKHVVLEVYHTQRTFKYVVCKSLSTIVMLVVHTHKVYKVKQ